MKIDPLLLSNQSQGSKEVMKVSLSIMRWVEGQSLNSHKREDKYQYNYIIHYHYNIFCFHTFCFLPCKLNAVCKALCKLFCRCKTNTLCTVWRGGGIKLQHESGFLTAFNNNMFHVWLTKELCMWLLLQKSPKLKRNVTTATMQLCYAMEVYLNISNTASASTYLTT